MKSKRIDEIESYILENQTVTLDQLCERFNVSKNTIRRDLEEILKTGQFKKIYGGVSVEQNKELIPFRERNIKNLELKQKIGRKAGEFIEDNDIVFVDSGTTTCHIIEAIKDKKVTIITHSLDLMMRALPYENITLISLSGVLNRETLSFAGFNGAGSLKDFNISKAFMASTGFSIEKGVTNSSVLEFDIKQMAIKRSQHIFLLVDSSKVGVISLMTYAEMSEIDVLITDKPLPEKYDVYFREHDIKQIVAEG